MKKNVDQPQVAKMEAVPVAEVQKISYKELVADFLTAKPFQNSRIAYRQFCKENPAKKIKQTYFYTLFVIFGLRIKKKDSASSFIGTGTYKNCMTAYKAYVKSLEPNEKAIVFAYFLNLWKCHYNLKGSIRTKAIEKKGVKMKIASKKKIVAAHAEIIELSKMSAKQILAKAEELLQEKAKTLPTNIKNKAGIIKSATTLFQKEGYIIA